ncbi:MAG: hypothetical protein ACREV5_15600 [Steroidobacter sp.]
MNIRTWWLLPFTLFVALAQAQDGPTSGSWTDFSDGLDLPGALDLIDVLSDSDVLGVTRSADDLLRNAESLDSDEAACGSAYTDASGPTVPSQCAENENCRDCYEEAVRKVDFNRYYIERARCITAANVKMANSAVAFGDSASGIHAVAGLSWQLQGKPQIEGAVTKLKKTYTDKAAQYLGNLQGALQELGQCEANYYGERDWYQRYGWIYHNFMKAKYASAPE